MRPANPSPLPDEISRLVDENEQLRALLESALDESSQLAEERDRLRQRLSEAANELRAANANMSRQEERSKWLEPAFARQGETEEELRVAFEELQVLTEELELANIGLHQTNQELDARVEQRTKQLKDINDALQATEATLRTVADLAPQLLWRADAGGKADWFNQRWLTYSGTGSDALLGARWLAVIHPLDHAGTMETWKFSIASGKPFEHEFRLRAADGSYRWFLVRAEPLRDDNNRIVRWFAAAADIHDQRLAIEALQRSELRFRTLIEGMPQLVWRAVEDGLWTWASPQWSAYTAQSELQARGRGWLDAFHPEDRAAAGEAWQRAQDSGVLEIEGRIFHAKEGRHRHFRTRAHPARDASGAVIEWLGTSTDVDDILQLQEQQGVLVSELQHRTRNLMAVVQAVTGRTLKTAASLEQFGDCIRDRLGALARVQGLLSRREAGARVPFDLLLREELSAHLDLAGQLSAGKIRLQGPESIPLRSATVQTFALALHELATNAVKYGALSDHGGELDIRWGVGADEAGRPALWVDWRETGVSDVPKPGEPAHGGGYGRELIERALPYQLGARTAYELTPDGVHCTIEVDIPVDHGASERADG